MQISIVSADSSALNLRMVRFACSFGCIRCATTVYHYCTDVETPQESDVMLLCPRCLAAMNRADNAPAILSAMRASPMTRDASFDRRGLPYMRTQDLPDVRLASGTVMRETAFPIVFGGMPILGFSTPEADGAPVQLGITLGGRDGTAVHLVAANEWLAPGAGWTFERLGHRYIFAGDAGEARLVLAFAAGQPILIEELHCRAGERKLVIDGRGARIDGRPVHIPNASGQLVGATL